ncbi:MAG: response regulator [Bacteroidetes bacterium]|nr:response regulator [Bacteroidota bacterium]
MKLAGLHQLEREMMMDETEKDNGGTHNTFDNRLVRDLRRKVAQPMQALERALASERELEKRTLHLHEEATSNYQEFAHSQKKLELPHDELATLNRLLQELLEQQKGRAHLLQSLLLSSSVAIICLDPNFRILASTAAASSIFSISPTDIARPLSDLQWLAADPDVLRDAHSAASKQAVPDREVPIGQNRWYRRRIELCYDHAGQIDGVLISYVDVTDQHLALQAQKIAVRKLRQSAIAKTRILSAFSHDFRHPLQTLTFIQKLLARDEKSKNSAALLGRMEHAVSAMVEILNTMLDINKIEAGNISFQLQNVQVHDLLKAVCSEFEYQATAKSIELKLIRSSAVIRTDPGFFKQIIRNLLSNAIRYTDKGRVSVGCRKRGDELRIEIWDTGIGIPAAELENIFIDYHNAEDSRQMAPRGAGLGLSIVRHLADLLSHQVHVSSKVGFGTAFSVVAPLAEVDLIPALPPGADLIHPLSVFSETMTGEIFIIENDPDVRTLLELLLSKEGYSVSQASDLTSALALLGPGRKLPDLIIVDYNLAGKLDGCSLARIMIASFGVRIPVIILAGDITAEARQVIAEQEFTLLCEPVRPDILESEIKRLLEYAAPNRGGSRLDMVVGQAIPRVIILDNNEKFNEMLSTLLTARGYSVTSFSCGATFIDHLKDFGAGGEAICILVDAYLGSMDGLSILHAVNQTVPSARVIMTTGASDVQVAVRALKAGAVDFFEKPIDLSDLIHAIDDALETSRDRKSSEQEIADAAGALSQLTPREQDVLKGVLAGQPNKNIADDLGISQRTVESHRASVMAKTNCRTLPELVRIAIKASWPSKSDVAPPPAQNSHR